MGRFSVMLLGGDLCAATTQVRSPSRRRDDAPAHGGPGLALVPLVAGALGVLVASLSLEAVETSVRPIHAQLHIVGLG